MGNALKEEADQTAPVEPVDPATQQIRAAMRQATRRQWWLWTTGVMVVMLLVVGVASFAFSGLLPQERGSDFYRFNLDLAVRGLVGLALLFGIYVIHQQLQIHHADTIIASALDKIQERMERVYKLAGRDGLTDLYNRQFGEQRVVEEMSRSRRCVRPLALVRLNLDGIENIGEKLGSATTDCAIRLFAEHLRRELRGSDIPIRLNGGEFLVLLPECNASEVEKVFDRLRRMTLEFGDQQCVEVIAGWTEYSDGDAPQTLIMRAESAIHAKQQNGSGETRHVKVAVSLNGNKTNGDERIAGLSRRERQVFELLARGKVNKEVASALGISLRTAESYRASIMSKLDVHSATDLMLYALRNGIIDTETF
ncbi:MAG: diguanylate cyclase [Candidatus Acidiferrum sp.]